jgi:hypothetical protein
MLFLVRLLTAQFADPTVWQRNEGIGAREERVTFRA